MGCGVAGLRARRVFHAQMERGVVQAGVRAIDNLFLFFFLSLVKVDVVVDGGVVIVDK